MMDRYAAGFFREYMGVGLLGIWFLASVLYLFLEEKRKQIRILFLYVPILVLLLFFNPLFSGIFREYIGEEIYYRLLWLLPVTVAVAYAAASVCGKLVGWKRLCGIIAVIFMTIVSGRCVYDNSFFSKAENPYHVPDSVVHICDAIVIEGREVMAVFPLDLVQYVRQYSPVVCMPYGRELLVDNRWTEWTPHHDLCDAMEAVEANAQILGELAREENCVYIILPGDKHVQGNLLEQGYAFFGETDGYIIYKDIYFEPGV